MRIPRACALALAWTVATALPLRPQVVDTVRVGSASLRIASLEEGRYTIDNFREVEGEESLASTTTQEIRRESRDGLDLYVVRTVHATVDGDTTVGTITARASDLSLLHHRVKARADSAAVTAEAGHLTGWVSLPDQPVSLIDQNLDRPVFPIEGQIPWQFPLLPLEEGYAAAIPHYSEWRGEEQWTSIRVIGSERVDVDGRTFDCWKVDGGELFPGYDVTYWVDRTTRRVVREMARGSGAGPVYRSRMRADPAFRGRPRSL